jgi:hypothetical protein
VEKFYLIGTTDGPEVDDYLDHEVSHGFYYTNESYRQAMEMLLGQADATVVSRISEELLGGGYCEEVIVDECIAYLASGLPTKLEKNKLCLKACGPFEELLQATKKELS